VQVCLRVGVLARRRVCVQVQLHAGVPTSFPARVLACKRDGVQACKSSCVYRRKRACVHSSLCAVVLAFMCACMSAFLRA
jgi:hypothetical protein